MKELSIKWSAEDIQTLRPEWSVKECEQFLASHADAFKQMTIANGWDMWEIILNEREGE